MQDNSTLETTKKRLEEIEKEIAQLEKTHNNLKQQWEAEKDYILKIRSLKEKIENAKHQAEEFERDGNLAKVAEIRYGIILNFEKTLKDTNSKLQKLQSSGKMLKEEVDAEDIAEIIAKWTHIPVQKMLETERTKLIHIEERIHQRLVGQDEAVSSIANSIRRSRAGLQDANKPIGSFIFLGTTGVGKTEMAKALAEFLFDDENALVRLDMSEYMEKFSVSRLIGAPPGYVGYEEGGQLTEAIRRRPYSVVLLDEIEKANKDVFNTLLQVLDDGRLTDGKGRTVNFKNTIIIMTSNLGTELIQSKIEDINDSNRDSIMDNLKDSLLELLKTAMRPEFLNRIDEIIIFKPLTKNEIQQIANLQLNFLIKKLSALGINLKIDGNALEKLTGLGFDSQYGARPLKRVIQKYIGDVLAYKLLSSEFIAGDTINIEAGKGEDFEFVKSN